jgi:hypothetical protein
MCMCMYAYVCVCMYEYAYAYVYVYVSACVLSVKCMAPVELISYLLPRVYDRSYTLGITYIHTIVCGRACLSVSVRVRVRERLRV